MTEGYAGIPQKAQECVDCGALALASDTECAGCGGDVRPVRDGDRQ